MSSYRVWHPLSLGCVALLLCACGPRIVYEYTPPATPEGRLCVAHCLNGKQLCEQLADSDYRQCQMNYELMMHNYRACEESKGKNCLRPSLCFGASDTRCQSNYRDCFTLCGGHIKAVVVE